MAWLIPLAVGTATGVLSGFGVGGGTLLLVYLTAVAGADQHLAQGINLLYFLPTAGVSLFFHRKNGYLEKEVLRRAVPLGTLCALGTAWLATSIDIALFRKPFGLFLLYAGVSMLLKKEEKS